jgi:hypothetical protein
VVVIESCLWNRVLARFVEIKVVLERCELNGIWCFGMVCRIVIVNMPLRTVPMYDDQPHTPEVIGCQSCSSRLLAWLSGLHIHIIAAVTPS